MIPLVTLTHSFMFISRLKENIGNVVALLPAPLMGDKRLPAHRNKWIILSENENPKGLYFKNALLEHEFPLGYDNIRNSQSPDSILLKVQLILKDGGEVFFQPFLDVPEADYDDLDSLIEKRHEFAKSEIKKLSGAEQMAIRQILIEEKMTDTDISRFLDSRGVGPYDSFFAKVSTKTPFLDREFSGYNTIKSAFIPILWKLLDRQ